MLGLWINLHARKYLNYIIFFFQNTSILKFMTVKICQETYTSINETLIFKGGVWKPFTCCFLCEFAFIFTSTLQRSKQLTALFIVGTPC